MIPAAIVVMWRMAQIVAPQLTHSQSLNPCLTEKT